MPLQVIEQYVLQMSHFGVKTRPTGLRNLLEPSDEHRWPSPKYLLQTQSTGLGGRMQDTATGVGPRRAEAVRSMENMVPVS